MTTDERFAVLSALVDREPVDPDILALALDDPEGRAQLVDFVRLRALTAREFAAQDAAHREPEAGRGGASIWLRRAAAVVLPLALGLAGGAWWVDRMEERPPAPDRVLRFTVGDDWK